MSSSNLYIVDTKEVLLTVRTTPETRDEFKKVAQLRGATMSTLIHQYMVKLIREEKDREPKAFEVKKNRKPTERKEKSEDYSVHDEFELSADKEKSRSKK